MGGSGGGWQRQGAEGGNEVNAAAYVSGDTCSIPEKSGKIRENSGKSGEIQKNPGKCGKI